MKCIENDDWKDIPNYENLYMASKNGEIYSKISNKILKPFKRGMRENNQYLVVQLSKDKKQKTFSIHRIIAETFLDNPNNYPCVNHKDGNKYNNSVSNLEWCSYLDNNLHAISNGLKRYKKGTNNKNSKLSYEDVCYIKQHLILNDPQYGTRPLGKKFGVDHRVILDIFHNKKYQEVNVPCTYFISSDIHGAYSIWMKALEDAGFNKNKYTHKIIVCGDLFDRFDEAVKVYHFAKSLSDRLIYIRGNHEDLLFDCVKELKENDGIASSHHYHNRTVDTVIQFMNENILDEVLEFIDKNTVDYYETKNYIFVHGWVPYILQDGHSLNQKEGEFSVVMYPKIDLDANKEMWEHARWENGMAAWKQGITIPNKTIICGHYHCSWGNYNIHHKGSGEFTEDACFEPFIDKNIIAIDACTAWTYKVNVLVIEEKDL